MHTASRVSLIGILSIGFLFVPAGASAQQRPAIADQIAQAYGFGSFAQVEAIRYTFTLDGGPKLRLNRSWIWEPQKDRITFEGKDGKQYVVIAAGGPARCRSIDASHGEDADTLIAFALP